MRLRISFLFLLSYIPGSFQLIKCQCYGPLLCDLSGSMDSGTCYGDYCFSRRITEQSDTLYEFGCLSTVEDLSNFGCEVNLRGIITCVCNSNLCNGGNDLVLPVRELPIIKCYQYNEPSEATKDMFCFGHYCERRYKHRRNYDDFALNSLMGDCQAQHGIYGSILASRSIVDWSSESCNAFTSGDTSQGSCSCSTDFCNHPSQPINLQLGTVKCNIGSGTKITGSCIAQACYIIRLYYNATEVGCVDFSTQTVSTHTIFAIQRAYAYCTTDYCNTLDYVMIDYNANGSKLILSQTLLLIFCIILFQL